LAKNQDLIDIKKYVFRLRVLRAIYGETQAEFAERLGIKFKTWNEYERGYVLPTTTLLRIHNVFVDGGVIEWILTGNRSIVTSNFDKLLEQAIQKVKEQDRAKAKAQRAKQRVVADYIRKNRSATAAE
jgi:transcriptional regulator with XRE-family HTH domain